MAGKPTTRAKSGPLTTTVTVEGAKGVLKAFKDLPKEATLELKAASSALSVEVGDKIRAALDRGGRRAMLLGSTVKTSKAAKLPAVTIGGTKKLHPTHGEPVAAFELLFGTEFGAKKDHDKYSPHGFLGYIPKTGKFIFPTVESELGHIGQEWLDAADRIIAKWQATTVPDDVEE